MEVFLNFAVSESALRGLINDGVPYHKLGFWSEGDRKRRRRVSGKRVFASGTTSDGPVFIGFVIRDLEESGYTPFAIYLKNSRGHELNPRLWMEFSKDPDCVKVDKKILNRARREVEVGGVYRRVGAWDKLSGSRLEIVADGKISGHGVWLNFYREWFAK